MKTWLTIIAFLVSSTLLTAPTKPQEAAANLNRSRLNVVSFFKQAALATRPRCRNAAPFSLKANGRVRHYSYCVILVKSDEDIQVTFYLTDAHEMSWTTELLDAVFYSSRDRKAV